MKLTLIRTDRETGKESFSTLEAENLIAKIKKENIKEAEEVKNATESEFEITEEMKQGMLIGTLLILLLK